MSKKTAIHPTREENYAQWYQEVIKAAELAEPSSVRGCMVIKPWGYGIWENIQSQLDQQIKLLGHENIYCPLFIPLSHMEREAKHIEGFAKECAVVTHHRLEKTDDGQLIPTSPLEEPLIIRPTSETIIGEMFAKWVQSYRDLPILVNQWANIVRWEMRTRLFLRTSEFLWQEGHTVHATEEEAHKEALIMLDVYQEFVENVMAIPVIKGEKSESERFPGAINTYCIEAMTQDKKALQAGTSHFLGQNFSKAFNIKYLNAEGVEEFGWTTSWGVSTRLIGGLIMVHSDDDGLILPPKIAPAHAVIIPIIHQEQDKQRILQFCDQVAEKLKKQKYNERPIRIKIDTREMRGGEKAWHWVKKGIPLRIEIGPKECDANEVSMTRRDQGYRDRNKLSLDALCDSISNQLEQIQKNLFTRALQFRDQNIHTIHSEKDFYEFFKQGNGFVRAYWKGDESLEMKIKEDLSVTIRCIPLNQNELGQCIFTRKENAKYAIFSRAY